MKEIKEAMKEPKKALIKLYKEENENQYNNVCIDIRKPIYQALKLTPISELEYI